MSIMFLSIRQSLKHLLQAMTLAAVIIYTTLIFYQSTYGYPSIQQDSLQHVQYLIDKNISINKHHDNYSQNHTKTEFKLLKYAMLSIQTDPRTSDKKKKLTSSNIPARAVFEQRNSKFIWQQKQTLLQQYQGTTVVIRKDIFNFNFSDVEKSDVPKNTITSFLTEFERRSRNGEFFHDLSQRSVTATPKPPITELDDIFISVKTTNKYHRSRLALIINTWFQLARDQIWFFTDRDDRFYAEKTKGHLINTNCSQGHFRKALCCKMSVELNVFLESRKKWFCHFDDDNYVNVPRLVKILDGYSPTVDYYLGKPSISSPLEIHFDSRSSHTTKKITFWFATGGAGFCLSRALTLKMLPIAGGGKFIAIGEKIKFPDDVTMGFIIEHLLKVPLTVVDNFHSHLEPMEFIREESFHEQVSFSYAHTKKLWNVIKVDGFDLETDPKRLYSLHCHLFPYFHFCPTR